ncbi:MAG: acyl-CoA thioesterase [Pseudomonadota bacterium]
MPDPVFETRISVEFGDCDPAGIVFYPKYFAWFDACFQRWLRSKDVDQAAIQKAFGAVGTGLINVDASFRAPLRPGQLLTLSILETEWSEPTLRVGYQGKFKDKLVVEGEELRGLFGKDEDGALKLLPIAELRAMITV